MSNADPDLQVEEPTVRERREGGGRSRRRLGGRAAAVAGLVVALVLAAYLAGTRSADRGGPAPVQEPDAQTSPPTPWLSGASGQGVATGEFGEWRGAPVPIATTFADNNEAMVELPMLQDGREFGDWDGSLDIAVGAFDDEGSWEDAADGDYDDRWRESLEGIATAWESREGTVYIRFAHEMNGDWYPWAVEEDEADDFVEAWGRFRDLQQEVFPESQLVFCVNKRSIETGFDWRETFPGGDAVDVMSVDYYNQDPYVQTEEDWQAAVTEVDDYGAPVGLQRHLEFAREVGLPLAVSEWSGNADEGDSAVYIERMHAFFEENGGTGAGQLLYEVVFNQDVNDGRWLLYGEGVRLTDSAEAYQDLF